MVGTRGKVPICTPDEEGPPLNLLHHCTACGFQSCILATAVMEGAYFYTIGAEMLPSPELPENGT